MAKRQFTYEKQAMLSVVLAVAGGVFTLAGIVFILQKFRWSEFQLPYDTRTMRMPAIMGSLFLGLVAGAAGWLLGFASAGQRLNKSNKLSWMGFFICSGVVLVALCAGVFFWLTRFPTTGNVG